MRTVPKPVELDASRLRRNVDLESLTFETTEQVPPLTYTIGQQRAFDSISFGIGAKSKGFNLFVAGSPGSGRETTVHEYVLGVAAKHQTPEDWIYVHNFVDPDRPIAVSLPPGTARTLAGEVKALVQAMQKEIPRAFEAEEVQRQRDALINGVNEKKSETLAELQQYAKERDYLLEMTPTGMVSYATINDKPIEKTAYDLLPDSARHRIEANGVEVQEKVGGALRQFRLLDKAIADALRQLERDVVEFVTSHLFEDMKEKNRSQEAVLRFLEAVQADVPEHIADFRPQGQPVDGTPDLSLMQRNERLARYEVNVFIDNGETTGAPVVIERNPNFANLLGRIDYRATFGAMVTDFRQIKAGSLHRANGGFLILQALDLLRSPFAWETLKRALQCGEIEIENLADQISALPTARLRPAAIPLDLKVVLIGSPYIYSALYQLDEDFAELFSVKADFSPDMPWSDAHVGDYAAFISRHVRNNGLLHFDRGAVGRVVEEGSRWRENQRKLTTRFLDVGNLITEASYWADESAKGIVSAEDVDKAVNQRMYRASLVEERTREVVLDGTVQIATDGARIGQINGLAVLSTGDYAFGRPSRVSARVSVGRGVIHSIEREIELSGPIHSKGFLILSGYLQGQYGAAAPLALNATITFEQSYGGIDGDSASSTELYALLSALADLPLRQDIAVTGSVNQYGEVQAIGGANQKIEGFFVLCSCRGLSGSQGVMIPSSNVSHLMLNQEVVDAVTAGQFHIWPIQTIDEGIELLTGKPAGKANAKGQFPAGSVHRLVSDRLSHFLEQVQSLGEERVPGTKPKKKPAPAPKKALNR